MARHSKRPALPVHTFYIYDPGVKDTLGGARVLVEGSTLERTVVLTQEQAAYWINSGTIGPVPLTVLDGTERRRVHQLLGGRIPLLPEGRPVRPRRNAVQDPNTMAKGIVGGMSPVTGGVSDPTVSKQQRVMSQRSARTMFSAHEGLTPAEVRGGK